jgi:hypothetical protein
LSNCGWRRATNEARYESGEANPCSRLREADCRHDQEVHGANTSRKIVKESLPGLRLPSPTLRHVLGRIGNGDPTFSEFLALPLLPPKAVRNALDQLPRKETGVVDPSTPPAECEVSPRVLDGQAAPDTLGLPETVTVDGNSQCCGESGTVELHAVLSNAPCGACLFHICSLRLSPRFLRCLANDRSNRHH